MDNGGAPSGVSAQFIFPIKSQAKFPVKRVGLSAV